MLNAEVVGIVLPYMNNKMLQWKVLQHLLRDPIALAGGRSVCPAHCSPAGASTAASRQADHQVPACRAGLQHVRLETCEPADFLAHHHSFAEVVLLVNIHTKVIISCSTADI